MKKLLLTLSAFALITSACKPSHEESASKTTTNDSSQATVLYECPMKCEEKTYDKPGTCIVCGMDLIVKK